MFLSSCGTARKAKRKKRWAQSLNQMILENVVL
jgi:hypothetical protein